MLFVHHVAHFLSFVPIFSLFICTFDLPFFFSAPVNPDEEVRRQHNTDVTAWLESKSRTGGAYIPPARLAMMQRDVKDPSTVEFQRMAWEALKKSINGIINKVNVGNIKNLVPELFGENLIRGRGIFARSCMRAQAASPTFTPIYAALVAVVNTKLPANGELIVTRLMVRHHFEFGLEMGK